MKLSTIATFLAVAVGSVHGQGCTAQQRLATLMAINTAFNEPNAAKAAADIQAFPLQYNCPAIVAINGAPGIEFGQDAQSSKNFAIAARQVFNKVTTTYTDYGNGTSLFDAIIELGLVKLVNSDVYAHAYVPIEFNLTTCQITELPAYVTVPVSAAGIPISPPIIPVIPGLAVVPGFATILEELIPEIGNIYNL